MDVVPKIGSDEMNGIFTVAVSNEEIKGAMFELGAEKAPRLDGFNGVFYGHYWDITGDAICKVVKEFFEKGEMLRRLNETRVVFAPKVKNAVDVSQFQPISYFHFSYKILLKVMVNRLNNWMGGWLHRTKVPLYKV